MWELIFFQFFAIAKALSSNPVEEVMAAATTLPLGSLCEFTSQCIADNACIAGRCRRNFCRQNYECSRVFNNVYVFSKILFRESCASMEKLTMSFAMLVFRL